MEGFSAALLSLVSTLASTHQTHISTTRLRIGMPRLTPESLPNELILRILEDANGYHWDLASLVKFSHISSHIRKVVLNTHYLWAKIPLTLDIPAFLIEEIALRSGTFGLSVSMGIDIKYENRRLQFCATSSEGLARLPVSSDSVIASLSKIFEYCHRWEDASMMVHHEHISQHIREHFPHANLASIHSLRMKNYYVRSHFCHKWTMPHLEELDWRCQKLFPPSCVATPGLRICSLDVEEPTLTDFVTFLTCTPSLTNLKLNFRGWADSEHDGSKENQVVVDLPNLEHLELVLIELPNGATARFLETFMCSGLKDLSIATTNRAAYLDSAQRIPDRHPLLESFTLVIGWTDERQEEQVAFFDDIACLLPGTITKITVKGLKVLRSSRGSGTNRPILQMSFPHLKGLDLADCHGPSEDGFYANLSKILRRFCVTLDHFRPCGRRGKLAAITEDERTNAMKTLLCAGVLVDSSFTY